MVECGGPAFGLGQQPRDGPIGVHGRGLGLQHLLPELERTGQVAAYGRQLGRVPDPVAAPAEASASLSRCAARSNSP